MEPPTTTHPTNTDRAQLQALGIHTNKPCAREAKRVEINQEFYTE